MAIRTHNVRTYLAVFFLSASTLAIELVYTRILSAVFRGNIAFLAISSAMLGVSLGGILVSLIDRPALPAALRTRLLRVAGLLYPLTVVFSTFVFWRIPADRLDYLPFAFGASILPITFASICLATILKSGSEHISVIYGSDLLGACAGTLLGVLALTWLDPLNSLLLGGVIAAAPFAIFAEGGRRMSWIRWGVPLALLTLIALNAQGNFLTLCKPQPGSQLLFAKSNSYSTVTVSAVPGNDRALLLEIDAGASSPIEKFNGDFATLVNERAYIGSLPHLIAPSGNRALIIGPGGGIDLLTALRYGSAVTGVEINPIIADAIMRGAFAKYSGNIYAHPQVQIAVAEGRSYIHNARRTYDIIQLPLVDTWAAAAAGAFTLTENNLYTVEAFLDYFDHLNENGSLSITRWEADGYRLVVLAQEAMRQRGIANPPLHIVITQDNAGLRVCNFLFKKSAFTPEELETIRAFARRNDYAIRYDPKNFTGGSFGAIITSGDWRRSYPQSPIDISPTTDDQPYFFNYIKRQDFYRPWVTNPVTGNRNANRLLWVILTTALFTLLLFVAPIGAYRTIRLERTGDFKYLAYFGSIGLGFMFLEIVLIQRFILFLEHPIYSYSVVLMSVLLFTGIGSLTTKTSRPEHDYRNLRSVLAAVCCLALGYRFALPLLINAEIGQAIAIKIILTALAVAPLSFFMGQAFPLGIKIINRDAKTYLIPWLWAVNGAASVLASVLAIFFAMYFGFTTVFTLGAAIYLLTLAIVALGFRPGPTAPHRVTAHTE